MDDTLHRKLFPPAAPHRYAPITCAPLPAFSRRLATLAEADWRQVIGARDMFTNLPDSGKAAINRLCETATPSAAELMAALTDALHSRKPC